MRAAAAPPGGAGGGGVAGAREISRVCVWGLGAAARRAMRLGGGNAGRGKAVGGVVSEREEYRQLGWAGVKRAAESVQ